MPNRFLKGLTLVFFVALVSAFVLFRCGALNSESENVFALPTYDHISGIGGNDTISFGDSIRIHRQYISSTKSGLIFDFEHPAYEDFMQQGIEDGFVVLDTLKLIKIETKTISIDSIYIDPMFYGSKSGKIFEPSDSSFLNSNKIIKSKDVEQDEE